MEGWLQVPPQERNLIGRNGWKIRYVRCGDNISLGSITSELPPPPLQRAHRASISGGSTSTTSTSRPGTSGSGGAQNTVNLIGGGRSSLGRSQSTHQIPALAIAATGSTEVAKPTWSLAIYKTKIDHDPIAVYPMHRMASCYVGDVASSKKKSIVQSTLIVHFRNEPPPTPAYPPSRAFRRRSSDTPPREGFRKEGATNTTLLFRQAYQSGTHLDEWREFIQTQLAHHATPRINTFFPAGNSFQEHSEEDDEYLSPTRSPSSLFIVDGEPSTTLLSPSIRSKLSNLSTGGTESDKTSNSSSTSLGLAPGRPTTSQTVTERSSRHAPPPLHIRTASSARRGSAASHGTASSLAASVPPTPSTPDLTNSTVGAPTPEFMSIPTPPARRETILDRYFSNAPTSPSYNDSNISSLARFEALLDDLEARGKPLPTIYQEATPPKRVPSPTQRALQYVATGRRSPSPPPSPSASGLMKRHSLAVRIEMDDHEEDDDEDEYGYHDHIVREERPLFREIAF